MSSFAFWTFRSLRSNPIILALFRVSWALWLVLPPGAQLRSTIVSPGFGARMWLVRMAGNDRRWICPSEYHAVSIMLGKRVLLFLIPTATSRTYVSMLVSLWWDTPEPA